ncbi:MAG TPA: G5 domain-containing protein, partial [Verrucomicrobiae bacterium]|nr:G5 domain-containing protein [Verrucomicrobiae bacterium]
QTGKQIYPEDIVTAAPVDNFLAQQAIGSVVTIKRSLPVTLDINGFPAYTRTQATTVGAFLREKGIELGKTGTVNPAQATPLQAGQLISVVRDGTGIRSIVETIAMPVQVIYDSSLAYGTSAVRQAGNPGRRVLTYRIVVKNGQVVSKELVQSVTTEDAVTQIVVEGTNLSGIKGDMAQAGIPASQYQYADYIISHESGWCPTKWQGEVGYCPPTYQAIHNTQGPDSNGLTYGFGLCQSTPAGKMASAGDDWAINPITQLKWCTGYADRRYGSWYNAYSYWIIHHNW